MRAHASFCNNIVSIGPAECLATPLAWIDLAERLPLRSIRCPNRIQSMPESDATSVAGTDRILMRFASADERPEGLFFVPAEERKHLPARLNQLPIEPTPNRTNSRSNNSWRIPYHKKIGGKGIAPCRHRSCRSTVFALCL
jgi:hypothetical protein